MIELRSPTDRLPDLRAKMAQWVANGAQVAWLIDPEAHAVEVYRPGQTAPDVHEGVSAVHGDGPIEGFVLEMARIWR